MATERPTTTIVESRGSGVAIFFGVVVVLILAVLAYMFLINDTKETNAVTGAAQSVGQAAESVGDAAKDTTTK